MDLLRRKALLTCLALPTACAFQPLPPVNTRPLTILDPGPLLRPPAIGQTWTYKRFNGFNGALMATEIESVTALDPRIVIQRKTTDGVLLPEEQQRGWGQVLRDVTWDRVQNYDTPTPLWPTPLAVGASDDIRCHYVLDDFSFEFWTQVQSRVLGWETVSIPAGSFTTLKIERLIRLQHFDIARATTERWDRFWLAPEVGRWVVRETGGAWVGTGKKSFGNEDRFRWELVTWA